MYKNKIRNTKVILGLISGVLVAATLIASSAYAEAQNRQRKATASKEQVIACIDAALAARPGAIDDVDIDRKGGRIICEVGIIAENGVDYDVDVDLADNKVIRNAEDR